MQSAQRLIGLYGLHSQLLVVHGGALSNSFDGFDFHCAESVRDYVRGTKCELFLCLKITLQH